MRIYDYLYELSDDMINRLYGSSLSSSEPEDYSQSQWVCRAVFQSLSELSKHIVMRLLFLTSPIPSEDIFGWFQGEEKYFQHSIDELVKSRILHHSADQCALNRGFRESMKFSLSGLHEPWTETPKNELTLLAGKSCPTRAQLQEECVQKWNNILQFMITTDPSLNISQTVINYLLGAGLMQYLPLNGSDSGLHIRINSGGIVPSEPVNRLCITSRGYEYLLLDIQTQVWNFAYECLKKSGNHQIDVLSFLFTLSFCRVGNSYPTSLLTPIQRQLMTEFSHLGIIYQSSPQSPRFYPTQIAVNIIANNGTATHKLKSFMSLTSESVGLTSGSTLLPSPSLGTSKQSSPNINISGLELIVETNFQVVAYFTSDLHLAMLSLFVDNRGLVRLPNMALGTITRDSIKYALKMGITSQQIINFMRIHAHPRLSNRNPILPENVTDQIQLWEIERKRLEVRSSILINLSDVTSGKHLEELYFLFKNYSSEIKVLLWSDDQKKCLVVTPEGYEQLAEYARSID